MSKAEFCFRCWVHPTGDPSEIEVWFNGLEETKSDRRFVSEWAKDAMECEDLRAIFDLDDSKHWQVVGKAVVSGEFDYWGEYDEDVTIVEFQKAEVLEQDAEFLFGKLDDRLIVDDQIPSWVADPIRAEFARQKEDGMEPSLEDLSAVLHEEHEKVMVKAGLINENER